VYRGRNVRAPLPETERALDEALILPLYPQLTEEEQDDVVETLIDLVAVRS
jgi:dTDP-4-amino-4,6-dideoxygalactose transaminase